LIYSTPSNGQSQSPRYALALSFVRFRQYASDSALRSVNLCIPTVSRSTPSRALTLPHRHEIASLETFSPSGTTFSSLRITTDRKGGEGSLKGDPHREAKKEEIFLTRLISVNEHILFAFPSRSFFCGGICSKANFTGVRHYQCIEAIGLWMRMGEYEKCFCRFLHFSSCSLFLHGLSTLESSRSQWLSHSLLESAPELPRTSEEKEALVSFSFSFSSYYTVLPQLSTRRQLHRIN